MSYKDQAEGQDRKVELQRPQRSQPKLLALQVLRAVAASLVVVDHVVERLVNHGVLPAKELATAYYLGWLGVGTFFVISGFIMYATSYRGFGTPYSSLTFMIRRIVRVVPLYWIATLFAAATSAGRVGNDKDFLSAVLKSLFFIPYVQPGQKVMRPILGVGWTLNYEMFFYILFAAALLLPLAMGTVALLAVLSGLVVIGALFYPLTDYSDPVTLCAFYTAPFVLLFGCGVLLGWLEKRFRLRINSRVPPVVAVLAAYAAAVIAFRERSGSFPLDGEWQATTGLLCVLAVGFCIYSTRISASAEGSRVLVVAGDASYSTYLFHYYVVAVIGELWLRLPLRLGAVWSVVVLALLSVIVSNLAGYLIHILLERPLTGRLRKSLGRFA